eukprot:NODE_444_length_7340_cov_0.313631.p2 type:complete len:502 gc:universal NODE_444_length_7340_cov_0.313631:109-1614(+)
MMKTVYTQIEDSYESSEEDITIIDPPTWLSTMKNIKSEIQSYLKLLSILLQSICISQYASISLCMLLSLIIYDFYEFPFYLRLILFIGKLNWFLTENQIEIPFMKNWTIQNPLKKINYQSKYKIVNYLIRPVAESSRLTHLDTIRGIAALIVVIHHSIQVTSKNKSFVAREYNRTLTKAPTDSFRYYFQHGNLMVPIFLVLSGFILCKIHWTPKRSKNLKRLIIGRLTRFYPIFWIAQILYMVFTYYSFCHWNNKLFKQINADGMISCLTLTHHFRFIGWGNQNRFCVYPAWTLSVELMFNLGMYLVIRYLPVYWGIFAFELATLFTYFSFTSYFVNSKILQVGFAFCIGVLYYKIFGKFKVFRPIFQIPFDFIVIYLLWNIDSLLLNNWQFYGPIWGLSLIVALDNSYFLKRVFGYFSILGDLSFAIYLLHVPLGDLMVILVNYGYISKIDSDLNMLFWLFILCSVSYLMHIKFEMPVKKYLDEILGLRERAKKELKEHV